MAVTIQVTFDDGNFGDVLGRLQKLGLDQTALMQGVSGALRTLTIERIGKTKASPDGVKWVPNKAGTPTLVRSGDLLRLISASHGQDFAQVGSALPYAAIHQSGGEIKRTYRRGLAFSSAGTYSSEWTIKIPARPYLGIGPSEVEAIDELVGAALLAAITPKSGPSVA